MSTQITRAAELDALPDRTVIGFDLRVMRSVRHVAAIKRDGKWYLTGVFCADGCGYVSRDVLADALDGVSILYRPDAEPVHTEGQVRDVLSAHRLTGSRCLCGIDMRLDWHRYETHLAAAVLKFLRGES